MKKLPLYLFFSLLICSCINDQTHTQGSERPNILLVMTDDQGYGDIGLHGNDSISTPHLDSFAQNGIQFDRFYVSPVCAPTRASLLTGRYHLRTGTSWVTHRKEVMRSGEITIAEALKTGGYKTGIFGKWHNGEQYPHHPNGQGFDEFFGFAAGHCNNYFDTQLEHNGNDTKTEGFITDVLTDKAIAFIEESKDQPFFCYLPYNAPHSPFQVPDQYFDKYKAKGLSDKNASVYGMVENLDDNFERLLKTLEEQGLRENTIVIFMTDNGPNGQRFNGGMRGTKASVHEGGVRVPLFIQWPQQYKKPAIIREITGHIDIMPTLLDFCQIDSDGLNSFDGVSVRPLLEGDNASDWPERQIYSIQNDGKAQDYPASVRTSQYRLVKQSDDDITLYDMLADPSEQMDVSNQYPEVAESLKNSLEDWYVDVTKDGTSPPPVEIGHKATAMVHIPAQEGILNGAVTFEGGMGWANDWLKSWDDDSHVTWKIKAIEPGKHEIKVKYVANSLNPVIQLKMGNATIKQSIQNNQITPYLSSPDRVKRGEVYERVWHEQKMTTTDIPEGYHDIQLSVLNTTPTDQVLIKGIEIVRL